MTQRYIERGTKSFKNTMNLACRYCGVVDDKMAREPTGIVACLPCARADEANRV